MDKIPRSKLIRMAFLAETAHLGVEGQKQLLVALRKARQHRDARLAAKAAIEKAAAKPPGTVTYPITEERIHTGGPPAPGEHSTYTPPPPYVVLPRDPADPA